MGVRFWPLFDQREVFGSIRFFINVNPVNWLNENLALLENLEFWIPKFGRQKTVPEPAVCSNCVLDTNVDLVEFSTHIRIKENLWPPNSRPSASSRLGLHSPIEFTDRLNSASGRLPDWHTKEFQTGIAIRICFSEGLSDEQKDMQTLQNVLFKHSIFKCVQNAIWSS